MNRLLAVLTVGLVAGTAVADIPPPPPPKGKKYVSVNNEVVLAKDVTGYVFVQEVFTFPGRPTPSYDKFELTAGKAKATAEGGRRTSVALIAVPEAAAKEFKTDADLIAAIQANKVMGTHRMAFASIATVPDTVKGDSVKWTVTVTAIGAKGIKAKIEGVGSEPVDKPKKDGKDSPEEDDSDDPAAHAPRGGTWVAGVAAALAVTLGGFWLAGRTRRKG